MIPIKKSRRYFVLLMSILGTVALFLPFTYNTSPWDAIRESWMEIFRYRWHAYALGAPFFLAIPVLVWQIRRLIAVRPAIGEIVFVYSMSALALAATGLSLGESLFKSDMHQDTKGAVATISGCLLLAANILLLTRNRRVGLSSEATAEAFLLGAYLPNAIICLLAFGDLEFKRLQAGAYVIAVVAIGYVAAIVLLTRDKSGGAPAMADVSRTKRLSQPPQS